MTLQSKLLGFGIIEKIKVPEKLNNRDRLTFFLTFNINN